VVLVPAPARDPRLTPFPGLRIWPRFPAMGQIINLRTRRKQAARDTGRQAGTENAARHGEGKAAAGLRKARAEKAARDLDAHRREDEPR